MIRAQATTLFSFGIAFCMTTAPPDVSHGPFHVSASFGSELKMHLVVMLLNSQADLSHLCKCSSWSVNLQRRATWVHILKPQVEDIIVVKHAQHFIFKSPASYIPPCASGQALYPPQTAWGCRSRHLRSAWAVSTGSQPRLACEECAHAAAEASAADLTVKEPVSEPHAIGKQRGCQSISRHVQTSVQAGQRKCHLGAKTEES